jgi:hypothetical protein
MFLGVRRLLVKILLGAGGNSIPFDGGHQEKAPAARSQGLLL